MKHRYKPITYKNFLKEVLGHYKINFVSFHIAYFLKKKLQLMRKSG